MHSSVGKSVTSLLLQISMKGRELVLCGEEAGSPLRSKVNKGRVGKKKRIFLSVLEMCSYCNHFVSENLSKVTDYLFQVLQTRLLNSFIFDSLQTNILISPVGVLRVWGHGRI